MSTEKNNNDDMSNSSLEKERLQCPACKGEVTADAKFCSSCGQSLASAAKPTPAPLLGERRLATVLMSDLKGYTQMSELLDPEDVASIMGQIKDAAGQIIDSYGGTVNQFVGDEVIALFGIPIAHEDDASRAIGAARALHAFVREMNKRINIHLPQPLSLHSGIQTGLIIAEHRDHRDGVVSATGDTLNTASRLLSKSGEDEILIGPETQNKVATFYLTKSVGYLSLKGKADLLEAFSVLGPSEISNRFEAAQHQGFSQLTGRSKELDTLSAALNDAKLSSRIVEVVGDAGVGKSRICHALTQRAEADGFELLRGRCQSTGRVLPYQPFADAFARAWGILDADQSSGAVSKVVDALTALSVTDPIKVALILKVLSLTSTDYPLPSSILSDQLPELILDATTETLRSISARTPLVLYLEDWHWADEASIGLLPVLTRQLAEQSILILVDHRPEMAMRWSGQEALQLKLKPLPLEATRGLIAVILKSSIVQDELLALIHERAQGNPLFIEEICATLDRQGMLARNDESVRLNVRNEEIDLPSTVEALVHSRIDLLSPADRDILRIAAVIGPRVPLSLLQQVVPNSAALSESMIQLQRLEFLRLASSQTQAIYAFRHAIFQEVAYQSLLLRERTRIHMHIAEVIETLYQTQPLAEHVESLAHHYRAAGDHEKTFDYSEQAALNASKSFALAQARSHLEAALDANDHLQQDSKVQAKNQIRVAKRWAEVNLFGPSLSQIERLEQTMALAVAAGDYASAGLFRYWISWVYYAVGNQKQAIPILESMISDIRASGDTTALAPVLLGLGHAYAIARDVRALPLIQDGLHLREQQLAAVDTHHTVSSSILLPGLETFSECQIGLLESLSGNIASAKPRFQSAMQNVQKVDIKSTEASNWVTFGLGCIVSGDWQTAIECARNARSLGEHLRAHYHLDMSDFLEGYSLFKTSEHQTGKEQVMQSIANLEETGAQLAFSLVLAGAADVLLELGDFTGARIRAEQAATLADIDDRLGLDLALRVLHRLDLQGGDNESAAQRREALSALAKTHSSERESLLLEIESIRADESDLSKSEAAAKALSALRELELSGLANAAEFSLAV